MSRFKYLDVQYSCFLEYLTVDRISIRLKNESNGIEYGTTILEKIIREKFQISTYQMYHTLRRLFDNDPVVAVGEKQFKIGEIEIYGSLLYLSLWKSINKGFSSFSESLILEKICQHKEFDNIRIYFKNSSIEFTYKGHNKEYNSHDIWKFFGSLSLLKTVKLEEYYEMMCVIFDSPGLKHNLNGVIFYVLEKGDKNCIRIVYEYYKNDGNFSSDEAIYNFNDDDQQTIECDQLENFADKIKEKLTLHNNNIGDLKKKVEEKDELISELTNRVENLNIKKQKNEEEIENLKMKIEKLEKMDKITSKIIEDLSLLIG